MQPEEIRTRRLALGFSQERLARELGVSLFTVSRWETGRTHPTYPGFQDWLSGQFDRLDREIGRGQRVTE